MYATDLYCGGCGSIFRAEGTREGLAEAFCPYCDCELAEMTWLSDDEAGDELHEWSPQLRLAVLQGPLPTLH